MDNLPCLTRPVRLALVLAAVLSSGACSESLQQALQPDQTQNFGEQFFNIMCQRVAYTSSRTGHQASLAANKKDPSVPVRPLDVSGQEYRLACRYGPQHLPAHARARDPKVWTLVDGRNKGDTGPSNRKLLVDALNNMFLGSSKVSPTQEAKLLSDVQDYLVKILKDRTTIIFDNKPPFDLLVSGGTATTQPAGTPGVGGVALPGAAFALFVLWPYLDRRPTRVGVWFARERWVENVLFILFVLANVALIVIGVYFRGVNWSFQLPWEAVGGH